jgi:predicted nucleic acid-binding protein
MKTLFDTSVLVPALIAQLPQHAACRRWLDRAIAGEFDWCVSSHTLAELYASMTELPVAPRIQPEEARDLIRANIIGHAKVVALSADDYLEVIDSLATDGLRGGVTYDALIFRAAIKAKVQRLLTLNTRHFARMAHGQAVKVLSPSPNAT